MGPVVNVQPEVKTVAISGPYASNNSQATQDMVSLSVAEAINNFEVPLTVKDFGAVGDGITDDTTAIQQAINTIGEGGVVYFPPGTYKTSGPIYPRRQQILRGTHANKYAAELFPSVRCAIKADPATWNGDSVIRSSSTSYGVELRNLAIIGPGTSFASVVHGVYFGPRSESSGERAWSIKDCLISSCSGDGIAGHMWVFDMRDTHIAQCRTGLHTFDDDGLLDSRIIGCNIYFNRDAGILIDGGWTGAIDIIGCRVERSGNLYGYPATPVNPDAPGIWIKRGQQIALTNINTDANSGPGLRIGHPTRFIYNIMITNCAWTRDGGGTQQSYDWWKWIGNDLTIVPEGTPGAEAISNEGIAGVRLERCFHVRMINSTIGYGVSNDSGGGAISPTYAFKATDTSHCEVIGSRVEALPFSNSIVADSTNSNLNLNLPQHAMMKVPVAGEAQYLPDVQQIGLVAYQNDLQTLVVQNYSGEWVAMQRAGANSVFNEYIDIASDGTSGNLTRFIVDDIPAWTIGNNQEIYGKTFFLGRYDSLGAYVDSPIAVNHTTGRVDLNYTYLASTSAANIPLVVRAAEDQTTPIQEWWYDDSIDGVSTVAAVRPDGRIWGTPGVDSNDFVTVSQLNTDEPVSYTALEGTNLQDKSILFKTGPTLLWQAGVNPEANGNTFYVWRADATGAYLDTPLSISYSTGKMTTKHQFVGNFPLNEPGVTIGAGAGQTAPIIRAGVDGVTKFEVLADGKVSGTDGTASNHFVTKSQLDAAGGSSWTNSIDVTGTATDYTWYGFYSGANQTWEMGVYPDASSNRFYIGRYNAGSWVDAPLSISKTTGQVDMKRAYIEAGTTSTIPLVLRPKPSATVSTFRVENSSANPVLEVIYDNTVRMNWGSSENAVVKQGSTQIVREGATTTDTLLAAYTSTANAGTDTSVFKVYANGQVKIADATANDRAISLGQLKTVVAASTDFADFKTRVAAL